MQFNFQVFVFFFFSFSQLSTIIVRIANNNMFTLTYCWVREGDPLCCCRRRLRTYQIIKNGTIRLRQVFVTANGCTTNNFVRTYKLDL